MIDFSQKRSLGQEHVMLMHGQGLSDINLNYRKYIVLVSCISRGPAAYSVIYCLYL